MKYSKWVGLFICIALMAVCFLPWTYHADVHKNFTGFFSQNNAYGKPGKFIIFLTLLSGLLIIIPKLWAKRTHIFIAGILVAYAIKTYILYTSCYNAYCPEKKPGIFLMIGLSFLLFIISLVPDMKLKNKD
ncbi:MAG: hypothetical protein ABS68_07155 [Niastella sp. SCN 39-18]|nr:hypothetical protein [Sphingobacteriales bacterium]ODT52960.1 MAG: hypothetical protein ABS68_07155 [Niastella sp. SCN 39-18]OJW08700.1 MAG: hypothetical protein BGO53_13525 [Sphingobacteriales bacterium 39-19]